MLKVRPPTDMEACLQKMEVPTRFLGDRSLLGVVIMASPITPEEMGWFAMRAVSLNPPSEDTPCNHIRRCHPVPPPDIPAAATPNIGN
jgi:hypothetical protein